MVDIVLGRCTKTRRTEHHKTPSTHTHKNKHNTDELL
jgi:hypothetical protein